ncbi:MAG: hypothetical protein KY453_05980, partial [Gemmatimonadetes bacterium]|nr:hypothetical protein [Gemmatimonadota bacterium]
TAERMAQFFGYSHLELLQRKVLPLTFVSFWGVFKHMTLFMGAYPRGVEPPAWALLLADRGYPPPSWLYPLLLLVTLVAVAGRNPAEAAAALAILSAAPAAEAHAERASAELRSQRLVLDTGVRDLDDALPWASARIAGALGPSGFRRGSGGGGVAEAGGVSAGAAFPFDAASDAAWCGFGALAAGDVASALRAVRPSLDSPLHALLMGRIVAWTGEPERLQALRVEVVQAAAGLDPSALTAAERVVWRCALDAWLEAAQSLGSPAWEEPLRARRETLDAARRPTSGGLRLPVVGDDQGAPLLAALFGGSEAGGYRPSTDDPPSSLARGVRAWAAYATRRPEEGFRLLRPHLGAAFELAPGAWRAAAGHPRWDDAAAAGLAPAATLFGMLGAGADAYYGRLHLAPRLPTHWTRLGVTGLRVADARVTLRYSRRDDGHTFGIRQIGGRVPLTLVFEPEIPSDRPMRVRVDGAPADVGTEPAGERVRVRLQLPLDRDREVCVEPDDAGARNDTARA